jgi:hypothetical protein
MLDDRDRYWPRRFDEMASDPVPVSWLNEPTPPDNVSTLARTKQRSLHASLAETLASSRGLLTRLENGNVQAPPGEARVAVRDLYVQLRRTVQALSRCLELPLE